MLGSCRLLLLLSRSSFAIVPQRHRSYFPSNCICARALDAGSIRPGASCCPRRYLTSPMPSGRPLYGRASTILPWATPSMLAGESLAEHQPVACPRLALRQQWQGHPLLQAACCTQVCLCDCADRHEAACVLFSTVYALTQPPAVLTLPLQGSTHTAQLLQTPGNVQCPGTGTAGLTPSLLLAPCRFWLHWLILLLTNTSSCALFRGCAALGRDPIIASTVGVLAIFAVVFSGGIMIARWVPLVPRWLAATPAPPSVHPSLSCKGQGPGVLSVAERHMATAACVG